jgi:hypothetical protein
MVHVVMMVVALGIARLAWAGGAPALTEHESPRATDLLRAQRLAERTQNRLRVPRSSRRGWAHGGEGWSAPPKPADREPRVTINVGSSRRRNAKHPTSVD